MAEVYRWIKSILIFLVLVTIITNLLGKNAYQKYIDLITGMILVLLVISPFLKLLQLDETLQFYFNANVLLAEAVDVTASFDEVEQKQREVVLKEYKKEIQKQVESFLQEQDIYLLKIEVTLIEEKESDTFGVLKDIKIYASSKEETAAASDHVVAKIDVDQIQIRGGDSVGYITEDQMLSPLEINIKKQLSDFYNMDQDNINISIQE